MQSLPATARAVARSNPHKPAPVDLLPTEHSMYTLITPELLDAHRQDLLDMASPTRRGDHAPVARRSSLARALARLGR